MAAAPDGPRTLGAEFDSRRKGLSTIGLVFATSVIGPAMDLQRRWDRREASWRSADGSATAPVSAASARADHPGMVPVAVGSTPDAER